MTRQFPTSHWLRENLGDLTSQYPNFLNIVTMSPRCLHVGLLLLLSLVPAALAGDLTKSVHIAAKRLSGAFVSTTRHVRVQANPSSLSSTAAVKGKLYRDPQCTQAGVVVAEDGMPMTFSDIYVSKSMFEETAGSCSVSGECISPPEVGGSFHLKVLSCSSSFSEVPSGTGAMTASLFGTDTCSGTSSGSGSYNL